MIIRGQSGFGDTLYLKSAVEQLFPNKDIVVCSKYPELFLGYEIISYDRNMPVDYEFSYIEERKKAREIITTNQWEDSLNYAGLPIVEFKLLHNLKINPIKKQLLVIDIYPSFGHGKNEPGKMMPTKEEFEKLVDSYSEVYNIKRFSGKYEYNELLSIFLSCEKVLCQCGIGVVIAEGLNIPCDVIFKREAFKSNDCIISGATPEKIFTRDTSQAIIL